MQTTRVLLVDDNELIRAGVRQLLTRAPEFEVVGEAKNGRESVELSASLKPDVVLMDLRMPEIDGAWRRGASWSDCPPRRSWW